jgi:hypothetical protein
MSLTAAMAEARLHTCSLHARPFRPARPSSRPAVVCLAQHSAVSDGAATRRGLLAALSCAPAALVASKGAHLRLLRLQPEMSKNNDQLLINWWRFEGWNPSSTVLALAGCAVILLTAAPPGW